MSIKAGEIPRYSARLRPEVRLCAVAQISPSTSRKPEPAIGEGAVDALRHQIDRAHLGGDGAEIGFGDADDRGRAALQPVHHAPSAGANTG